MTLNSLASFQHTFIHRHLILSRCHLPRFFKSVLLCPSSSTYSQAYTTEHWPYCCHRDKRISNRMQFKSVNNHNSSLVHKTSGVPQGSMLRPLLFIIYINDLPDGIKSNVRLFANEYVINCNIHSNCDHVIFHSDLNIVNAWRST